jgi:voltage-dependent calcium channel
MYDMCDAEYLVASLYFIVIVIIMNFWLINLFVAVINEMFAKVREDSKHSAFTSSKAKPVLNDNEEGWSFREQGQAAKKPKRATWLQQFVKVSSPIWVVLVAIDLIVMGCKNFGMSADELVLLGKIESPDKPDTMYAGVCPNTSVMQ